MLGVDLHHFSEINRRGLIGLIMANTIRASVIQTCSASYSLSRTLEKFELLTRTARDRDGAQLVVFPEAL